MKNTMSTLFYEGLNQNSYEVRWLISNLYQRITHFNQLIRVYEISVVSNDSKRNLYTYQTSSQKSKYNYMTYSYWYLHPNYGCQKGCEFMVSHIETSDKKMEILVEWWHTVDRQTVYQYVHERQPEDRFDINGYIVIKIQNDYWLKINLSTNSEPIMIIEEKYIIDIDAKSRTNPKSVMKIVHRRKVEKIEGMNSFYLVRVRKDLFYQDYLLRQRVFIEYKLESIESFGSIRYNLDNQSGKNKILEIKWFDSSQIREDRMTFPIPKQTSTVYLDQFLPVNELTKIDSYLLKFYSREKYIVALTFHELSCYE